ncbi:hypothetical protein BJ165DRAFT_1533298 [Panaeolus papilionaceus]|nr:hypothetical protein BJ165DRAFT_1533298 [Panaeolus papilionaceus]
MSYHNHGSSYAPSSKYHAGPAPHGFPPASAASSWGTVPTATHHSDAASRYGSHPPGTPAQYGHALPPQMGAGQPPSPENFAQLNPYLAAPRQNNLFFDFASDPRSIPDFLNAQPAFQPALSNMKIAFEGQWNWTLQVSRSHALSVGTVLREVHSFLHGPCAGSSPPRRGPVGHIASAPPSGTRIQMLYTRRLFKGIYFDHERHCWVVRFSEVQYA